MSYTGYNDDPMAILYFVIKKIRCFLNFKIDNRNLSVTIFLMNFLTSIYSIY